MVTGRYTDATDAALKIALTIAKGEYQRNLVLGWEALSGATLKGKARQYSGRYAASRQALIARLKADNRLKVSETKAEHGRRVLVLEVAQ